MDTNTQREEELDLDESLFELKNDEVDDTFKYGQGVKLFAYSCKVKEVVLTTDQGNYTYSFR